MYWKIQRSISKQNLCPYEYKSQSKQVKRNHNLASFKQTTCTLNSKADRKHNTTLNLINGLVSLVLEKKKKKKRKEVKQKKSKEKRREEKRREEKRREEKRRGRREEKRILLNCFGKEEETCKGKGTVACLQRNISMQAEN